MNKLSLTHIGERVFLLTALFKMFSCTPITNIQIQAENIIYVSPDGTGDGSSIDNPIELQVALSSPNIVPGSILCLLDGVYTGEYNVDIHGSEGLTITIKSLNAYQAIIDGAFNIGNGDGIRGSYCIVKNIHFTNLDAFRGTWASPQGTISIPIQVYVLAPHVSVINNYIHDGGLGIGGYDAAHTLVVYGNLCWNNGWADDMQGGAQNIYTHGNNQLIKCNVFAGAFKTTFVAFSTTSYITNYTAQDNIIFNRGVAIVGSMAMRMENINIISNHILNKCLAIGYVFDQDDDVIVEDNIVYTPEDENGALNVLYFEKVRYQRNKLIGIRTWFKDPADTALKDWNVDNNEYHEVGDFPNYELDNFVSWQGWQAAGNDLNSTFDHQMPSANQVFVYPNEYKDDDDSRIGIVVIWNWEGLNTVAVDLTTLGLTIGETYRWRQAQDPLVDVDTWVDDGNPYTFAMTGHTVAKPIGFDEELIPTQFPTFGCFIIELV